MEKDALCEETSAETESFRWIVRLSDKAPGRRYAIVLVAFLAFGLGVVLTGKPLLGFLGFAIILASTVEFWLGAKYTVNDKGVTSQVGFSITSLPWEGVQRVVVEGDRVLFSPLKESGRTDVFRGVRVTLTPDLRDRVLESVRSRLPKDVRFVEY